MPVNVVLAWALMFGGLGVPALGHRRRRRRDVACHAASCSSASRSSSSSTARFRRYHLFGRFWRADWPRFRELWRIGLPIGGTLVFEVTIFNAAAFLMGLIGAEPLAAHAIALQIAAISFMVPLGLGQAATVRVGLAYGAGDRGRRRPRRLDRLRARRRLHGA